MEDASAPLIGKGHIEFTEHGYIFCTVNVTAGMATHPPYGLFTLEYSMVGDTPDGVVKIGRGGLYSTPEGLRWSEYQEDEGGAQDVQLYTKQTAEDVGHGALRSHQKTYTFGNSGHTFCRTKTESSSQMERCFSRDLADATISVSRYGLYNADGSRFELPQSPFSVKAGSEYGWAYLGGVWLPHDLSVTDGMTVTSEKDGTEYKLFRGKGRLWRHTVVDGVITDTIVYPGDSTVPTSLTCVRHCPKSKSKLTDDGRHSDDSETYKWDAATYTLAASDGEQVTAVGSAMEESQIHGVTLVAENIAKTTCDDGESADACESKIQGLGTYYSFDTSPQDNGECAGARTASRP